GDLAVVLDLVLLDVRVAVVAARAVRVAVDGAAALGVVAVLALVVVRRDLNGERLFGVGHVFSEAAAPVVARHAPGRLARGVVLQGERGDAEGAAGGRRGAVGAVMAADAVGVRALFAAVAAREAVAVEAGIVMRGALQGEGLFRMGALQRG